jgi:hypothetical protein
VAALVRNAGITRPEKIALRAGPCPPFRIILQSTEVKNKKRPDFRPALVVVTRLNTPSPQGAQKGSATNLGSLSEPRRKQNLYANPKRTAKFQISYSLTPLLQKSSNYFQNLLPHFFAVHCSDQRRNPKRITV